MFSNTSNKLFLLAFCFSLLCFTCENDDTVEEMVEEEVVEETPEEETPEEEVPEEPTIDPNTVMINTNSTVGQFYNFWSTRPMVNQTRFNVANFRNSIEGVKPYVKSYNMVRVLGGRLDDLNTFYRGVDDSGTIITNFSGLLTSLRNFMLTGFKPRIVLDNVPWGLSGERLEDKFGNTRPPLDYGLWRQYINAFLQTLVNEFGMAEVKTWRFRIATEPNFNPEHWRGSPESFYRHYDITVDEILKVIPDALVGPGNLLTEGSSASFTTEIIDHCATGVNFATGERGTKMDFFSISYYEQLDRNRIKFDEIVPEYRTALNRYPQFANIPFDIQEFGILRDENAVRGISLSEGTEVGASWYATITSKAFDNRITEIYDWGQEIESTDNLPSGRRNVTEMFLRLENGTRLESIAPESVNNSTTFAGIIPVRKDGNLYLFLYNHNTRRSGSSKRTLLPVIQGGDISSATSWTMNEWTIDKDNGIFMHELYDDIRAAGVTEKTGGRIYGNRPSDRFEDGWKNVFNSGVTKYTELSKLPQTITDSIVTKPEDNILRLEVPMETHSVKLIELIPR